MSVIGLTIIFMKLSSTRTLKMVLIDIVCFLLLAAPIVRRMAVVPIEKFNYLTFIIPMVIFVLLYLLSIYFSIKQYLQIQKVAVLRKG